MLNVSLRLGSALAGSLLLLSCGLRDKWAPSHARHQQATAPMPLQAPGDAPYAGEAPHRLKIGVTLPPGGKPDDERCRNLGTDIRSRFGAQTGVNVEGVTTAVQSLPAVWFSICHVEVGYDGPREYAFIAIKPVFEFRDRQFQGAFEPLLFRSMEECSAVIDGQKAAYKAAYGLEPLYVFCSEGNTTIGTFALQLGGLTGGHDDVHARVMGQPSFTDSARLQRMTSLVQADGGQVMLATERGISPRSTHDSYPAAGVAYYAKDGVKVRHLIAVDTWLDPVLMPAFTLADGEQCQEQLQRFEDIVAKVGGTVDQAACDSNKISLDYTLAVDEQGAPDTIVEFERPDGGAGIYKIYDSYAACTAGLGSAAFPNTKTLGAFCAYIAEGYVRGFVLQEK